MCHQGLRRQEEHWAVLERDGDQQYCSVTLQQNNNKNNIFFQCKNKRQYFPSQISSMPTPLSCNTELQVEKQELNLCLEWHFSSSFLSGLYLHYLFIMINSRLKSTSLCST